MKKVLYIFGQLSDGDIDWLLKNGRKVVLRKGAILISRGVAVDELFIVIDGNLSVCLGDAGGEVLAVLGPGELVGEMSFVDASPPSATVEVTNTATLYAIERRVLLDKITADTAFASRFYHAIAIFLADRLRSTQGLYEYRVTKKLSFPVPLEDPDELNDFVTEGFVLAGERFKRILDQMLRI